MSSDLQALLRRNGTRGVVSTETSPMKSFLSSKGLEKMEERKRELENLIQGTYTHLHRYKVKPFVNDATSPTKTNKTVASPQQTTESEVLTKHRKHYETPIKSSKGRLQNKVRAHKSQDELFPYQLNTEAQIESGTPKMKNVHLSNQKNQHLLTSPYTTKKTLPNELTAEEKDRAMKAIIYQQCSCGKCNWNTLSPCWQKKVFQAAMHTVYRQDFRKRNNFLSSSTNHLSPTKFQETLYSPPKRPFDVSPEDFHSVMKSDYVQWNLNQNRNPRIIPEVPVPIDIPLSGLSTYKKEFTNFQIKGQVYDQPKHQYHIVNDLPFHKRTTYRDAFINRERKGFQKQGSDVNTEQVSNSYGQSFMPRLPFRPCTTYKEAFQGNKGLEFGKKSHVGSTILDPPEVAWPDRYVTEKSRAFQQSLITKPGCAAKELLDKLSNHTLSVDVLLQKSE